MAEVEGRRPASNDVGSGPTMHCNACPGVKATAFCVDCHDYLCTDCTCYHQRQKITKMHTLLTGDKFPAGNPPKREEDKTKSIRKCSQHPNEKIKVYCQGHNTLCCVVCIMLQHEQCSKTYIPDIAEDFKTGPDYGKLNTDMQSSDQLIVDCLSEIDKCLKAVGTLKAGEWETLKKYRVRIIEYLDSREKELQAEMQQTHDEDVALLHELQKQLKTRRSELEEMRTKLTLYENNAIELFIAAKRTCSQLSELQSSLQKITEKIGYREYAIVRDTRMDTILQDKNGFARVGLAKDETILDLSATKLQQKASIQLNKKTVEDMMLCSTDKLLLSIFEQKKVTLVEMGSGEVLSEIALQDNPRLMCMVATHLAATTLGKRGIQFIQINGSTLKEKSMLNLDIDVYGVSAHNDNLVVSHDPPGLQIISRDGAVIHKLDNTTAGREVFKSPRWIATTSDSIYVTDWGTHQITRLDSSLTILQTFTGPLLQFPCGIIPLNRYQLLVCSRDNNSIVQIRPSTNSMTSLLEKQHGIESPHSLCFCKVQKKLYVAPKRDKVLVYQML